jgi:predicted aconitase
MSIQDDLQLNSEEQAMLDGAEGRAVQRAIEIVVALAKIYGARRLVPVSSVQVAGVSYKNLGEAGLEFLREWAAQGAAVRVSTTLNPAGIDLEQWQELGFSADFARRQREVIETYTAMGITPTCTCTPYWVGNRPGFGEHIAWAESSAVSFANSVLGARTNREGGPSALAAAICGRTAAYGLHLDESRLAHYRVDVRCPLRTVSDWSALGYLVGCQVRNSVPCFYIHDKLSVPPGPGTLACASPDSLPKPESPTPDIEPLADRLKSLGAAMAASGAVALYHIAGLTPEARHSNVLVREAQQITVDDLSAGYMALGGGAGPNGGATKVDLVSIGCPHASQAEIRQVAQAVSGKRLQVALWVTTARKTRESMATEVEIIRAAGGRVVADTCMVVAPVEELGFRTMATNSAKMALYTPSHSGLSVRFGTLETCIQAALDGTWGRMLTSAPYS